MDNMKEIGVTSGNDALDILHIACRFIFIARLVAADRAHFIIIAIVFVGIFGGVLVGVLLHIFCIFLVCVPP